MAVRIKTKKASPGQAFLKILAYAPTGAGKSILMLNFLEWVIRRDAKNKRAFVFDTEHSNDFYTVPVPQRSFHPEAYDFDTPDEPTRSIVTLRDFFGDLGPDDPYGAVGVDSATHYWESSFDLYTGKRTRKDGIPVHGWQIIKKPWRKMMENALNGKYHTFFTAREQNVFDTTDDEWINKGTRAQAEKNTGYEPNMTLRMYQDRDDKTQSFRILSFVEKDRSGIWTGKTIDWTCRDRAAMEKKMDEVFGPVYDLLVEPGKHSPIKSAEQDAEEGVDKLESEDQQKRAASDAIYDGVRTGLVASKTLDELREAWAGTVGNKIRLGDERYDALEQLKDTRKIEIQTAKAAAAV
jgi:hypothetical protein